MGTRLKEDELCERFADHLVASPDFRAWFLKQTGFADKAATARLLHQEQFDLRPRKRWWRHWWCFVPSLEYQRETDIFCVFENGNRRFALHIENKLGGGKFLPGQAESYRPRAEFMARQKRFMSYEDYETVLLAPAALVAKHSIDCAHFGRVITYESLAAFIPEFSPA